MIRWLLFTTKTLFWTIEDMIDAALRGSNYRNQWRKIREGMLKNVNLYKSPQDFIVKKLLREKRVPLDSRKMIEVEYAEKENSSNYYKLTIKKKFMF